MLQVHLTRPVPSALALAVHACMVRAHEEPQQAEQHCSRLCAFIFHVRVHTAADRSCLQHPRQLDLARLVPYAEMSSFSGCTQLELLDPGLAAEESL